MKHSDAPLIIITKQEDLATFFPATWQQFKSCGINEWHGPCPYCPTGPNINRDRCIVSNGFVRCRQAAHCWTKKQRNPTFGVPLSLLNPDYKPDPVEQERLRREMEAAQAQQQAVRLERIQSLTQSQVWERFYENLQNNPEQLEALAKDGIDQQCINTFRIGLNNHFKWWDGDNEEHLSRAHTFPVFRMLSYNGQKTMACTNIRHRLLDATVGNKYRPFRGKLGPDYFRAYHKGIRWGFVAEGEKKAINLWRRGVPAIGLWGFETFMDDWVEEIRHVWPEGGYVLFDHDRDPIVEARVWTRSQAIAERLGFVPVQLPMYGKIDDLLNANEITIPQLMDLAVQAKAEHEQHQSGVMIR